MDRRTFVQATLGASLAAAGCRSVRPEPEALLARPRGFNLLEKFTDRRNAPYAEDDFRMIRDWGFDFARLPMSYWCWSSPDDPFAIDERVIEEVDAAVDYGERYGVHVNLNLHRAPGYCVNPPEEPLSLWTDATARDAFAFQWGFFAERYAGRSNRRVSFDLLNEPARIDEAAYAAAMRAAIDAIRTADPERLIVVDGLRWGRDPVPSLVSPSIWQSTRGYDPMVVSHYQASWVNGTDGPPPSWPLVRDGQTRDKAWLRREIVDPWRPLTEQGVTVHVGEWGAYNHTPHAVALAWMRDFLEIWQGVGWGWALWNLRGSFGVLDSGRDDVAYEPFHGHQLDREMLTLLQAH